MQLNLLLLKSGEYIMAQVEQMEYEPAVHLFQPFAVSGKTKIAFTKWPFWSKDEHVLFNSEELFTIVEPEDKVVDAKLKRIGKTREDFAPKEPEKIMLQENENLIDEEIEPAYAEEDVL